MDSVSSCVTPYALSSLASSSAFQNNGILGRSSIDVLSSPMHTLQNDLFSFVEQTKKKSGVTFDRALQYIQQGESFIRDLQAGKLTGCTRAEKRQYVLPFTWFLMSKAIEKGQGFKQGMFVFEDPGHRIRDFFGSAATKRWSSHYRGRVQGANFGIDISSGLPYKFHTVLFGGLAVLDPNEGEWTFLKPEDHGLESWGQRVLHFFDYLVSLHELIGKEQGPLDHKEDLLPLFRRHKHAMKQAGFVIPSLRKQNWGISGVIAALRPYMENQELFSQLCQNPKKKEVVISFLRDLQQYDWTHIRHGNEVVISERRDPFRAKLAVFLARLEAFTVP